MVTGILPGQIMPYSARCGTSNLIFANAPDRSNRRRFAKGFISDERFFR